MEIELRGLIRAKRILERYAEQILRIPVNDNKRFAWMYGRFDGRKKGVELAAWPVNDAEQLRETFLHFVAHAICFAASICERPHRRTWKNYADALGGAPEAFCDVDVAGQAAYRPRKAEEARAVGRCESYGYIFYRTRALPAGERICFGRDGDGLVCHGHIRKYMTRKKSQAKHGDRVYLPDQQSCRLREMQPATLYQADS